MRPGNLMRDPAKFIRVADMFVVDVNAGAGNRITPDIRHNEMLSNHAFLRTANCSAATHAYNSDKTEHDNS